MQTDNVIEVVADEIESDEFWWKTLFGILSLGQTRRLFDQLVAWYPFLDPRPKARRKTWHLRSRGLAKPDLVYQAVWRAARRLPPELRFEMLRDEVGCDSSAEFFHFLCGKSLEVGREEPARGVEVMELALDFLRGSAEELGDELLGLEAQGLARLANAYMLAGHFKNSKTWKPLAKPGRTPQTRTTWLRQRWPLTRRIFTCFRAISRTPGSYSTRQSISVAANHPVGCWPSA